MKPNFVTVMLSFFKMGLISFGGGSALIPVIENEVVEKKKWVDKKSFDVSVVVASISPASLSVALCAIWSRKYSLISSYSYAIPGPLIFLILLTGFALIGEAGVAYIGFASIGIISYILVIIVTFIRKNYLVGVNKGIKKQYLLIMSTAFVLTCGNVIRRFIVMLFGFEDLPSPIFVLTMLDLVLMAFFVILFIGNSKSKIKFGIALLIAGLFAIAKGKIAFMNELFAPISVLMIVLAIGSILYDVFSNKNRNKDFKPDMHCIRNLAIFLVISAILVTTVFLVSGEMRIWSFAARVMLSSLTSYGGGEVYIGVADGVFVQTGFIPAELYYSQIVGISSAMPGSVLLSTVAGIGFIYGNLIGGVPSAWMFGLLGLALGVAATALGSITLFVGFDVFKNSNRLKMVVDYMLAIVCGTLISTSLTMFFQSVNVMVRSGLHPWIGVCVVLSMFSVMMFLRKKYQINDILFLLAGGLVTLICFGIIF